MKLLFSVALLCAFKIINAQRYQQMASNRDNYVSIGIAYPYTRVKLGLQLKPDVFIEGQALTDGGAIWKEDKYNDWRSLTILKVWQFPFTNSKLKFGGGLVQTEEPPNISNKMRIETAMQLAYCFPINRNVLISWSITYPYSKTLNNIQLFFIASSFDSKAIRKRTVCIDPIYFNGSSIIFFLRQQITQ